MCGYEVQMNI